MTATVNSAKKTPTFFVLASIVWVLGFLAVFFVQGLPNNSPSGEEPLTRLDVLDFIFIDMTTLLNPFDYSSNADGNAGWHNLGERLPFLCVAATLLATAWSFGRFLTDRMPATAALLVSERIVIDTGAGLSLLSLWILLCGNFSLLTPYAILFPLLLVVGVAIHRIRKRSLAVEPDLLPAAPPQAGGKALWLLLIAAPFVLHILLGGFTPPFDFDVREYHMQGPKEWFQAGQVFELEHNVYTSFPFLSEMLSLGAMVLHADWWKGAIAGKLTLAAFQLLSALCVYAIGRRWIGRTAGFVGAVILLSTPWTVRISVIAYAEGAISFYLIASLMMSLLAAAAKTNSASRQFWGMTGFMAGSAMASKYPGVLSAVIPVAAFLTFATLRRSSASDSGGGQLIRNTIIFSVAVFAAVGPWLLKNTLETGNPVYPLAYSVFGGNDWTPEMDVKWKNGHSPSEHSLSMIPVHIFGMAVRNDWQNGLLFAFAVPSLFMIWRFRSLGWLWLHVVWMLATWWAFTHRIDRFWVPIIPVMSVLGGAAWALSHSRLWRTVLTSAIIVCCVFNYGFCRLPLIGRHAGLTDMETLRAQPVRGDIAMLNKTLPDNANVLMVGEAEVFDMDFNLVYNTVFDDSIFEEWTSQSGQEHLPRGERVMKAANEIRDVFRENGITHVYVNWSEILRYRPSYGYTDYVVPARFTQLQKLGLLNAPTPMSNADWDAMDPQQQNEIESWDGHEALRTNARTWSNLQLYSVAP